MHRHRPTPFYNYSHADFYVSFYIESLLFFQDQPLPFNGSLLFVPMALTNTRSK
jgi:hypothetical protein